MGHESEVWTALYLESHEEKRIKGGKSQNQLVTWQIVWPHCRSLCLWSFWCWIRANCWKTGVWWINFRLICMCMQCVILKIKNNINKHLGWLLFALVLTNTVLHLTLKCVALHINGLLLCLWKFSFNLSLSHTPSPSLALFSPHPACLQNHWN